MKILRRRSVMVAILALFACATFPACSRSAPPDAEAVFESRVYVGADNVRLPYRLYLPPAYARNHKYPLVVWLHGYDGIGTDNTKQITGYNTIGTHVWTTAANRESFPAIVVAPQAYEQYWSFPGLKQPIRQEKLFFEMIDAVQREFSIDEDRVYLAGQSMGGYGVYAYLNAQPQVFAAGVVLCGPPLISAAPHIARIPLWIFHGANDDNVPATEARRMVESLRKAGGNPRYTEFPNVGHEVSPSTFAEADLLPWLFAQKRVVIRH